MRKLLEDNIGENIIFLKQCKIHQYFNNFELNDINVIIDDKIVDLKYNYIGGYEYDKNSKDCDKAQNIYYELFTPYYFYYNFSKIGIHTIKIIFKRELNSCKNMFNNCDLLFEVDLSHFNCPLINSCESMFENCYSLKKINFGLLDFTYAISFEKMFCNCRELIEVDVSKFNTINSTSFKSMFEGCINLKKVDVSKFNSSKCSDISQMFMNCKNITEIDMINWNLNNLEFTIEMPNLNNFKYGNNYFSWVIDMVSNYVEGGGNIINRLFSGCEKLRIIKLNTNFKEEIINEKTNLFDGIPNNGAFIYKRGAKCNKLLNKLPSSWDIIEG